MMFTLISMFGPVIVIKEHVQCIVNLSNYLQPGNSFEFQVS